MNYCQNQIKAKVTYIKEDKTQQVYYTENVPIDISISTENTLINCWRFYGTGDDNRAYQLFASGQNPGFILNSGFNSRGYVPSMNGVKLLSDTYYYVSGYGYEQVSETSQISSTPGITTNGNCNSSQTHQRCNMTITDVTGHKFNDYVQCPNGSYQVVCGDDCPDGYCKIDCPHYPGYCCISCAEIDSLLLKLK